VGTRNEKNGTMEPKTMFYAHFTHIHDQGIVGVFNEDMNKKMIELVHHVNENSVIEKRASQ